MHTIACMSHRLPDPAATERFREARAAYMHARNEQRLLIADALDSAGFNVKRRGSAGRGLPNYTSGRRLNPPFDLSNWMWVEAERDGVTVTVTLQVLDQDPNSSNLHALVDRIGVHAIREGHPAGDTDPLCERATTDLQLPLLAEDLDALLILIDGTIHQHAAAE